jgi:hypothetical protein
MIEFVTVERTSGDLVKWSWHFWYDAHVLWLNRYHEFQRPDKRHKFRVVESYQRHDPRESTIKNADDVVLPADVMKEAVAKFCEGITVQRWTKR